MLCGFSAHATSCSKYVTLLNSCLFQSEFFFWHCASHVIILRATNNIDKPNHVHFLESFYKLGRQLCGFMVLHFILLHFVRFHFLFSSFQTSQKSALSPFWLNISAPFQQSGLYLTIKYQTHESTSKICWTSLLCFILFLFFFKCYAAL